VSIEDSGRPTPGREHVVVHRGHRPSTVLELGRSAVADAAFERLDALTVDLLWWTSALSATRAGH
jgi:hypothetical protein